MYYIYICVNIYLFIYFDGRCLWLRASTNEGSFFVQIFLRGENMCIYIYVYVYVCIIYIYVNINLFIYFDGGCLWLHASSD